MTEGAGSGFSITWYSKGGISAPASRYAAADGPRIVERLVAQIRQVPGVTDAAVNRCTPYGAGCARTLLFVPGRWTREADAPSVGRHYVSGSYFRAAGIALRAGRLLDDNDRIGRPAVTVINEAAADRFWPSEDPIGQRIWFDGAPDVGTAESSAEIVGIVRNVAYRPLDGFDISEAGALELPDALLRAIRVAVSSEGTPTSDVDAQTAAIREKVPEEHRAEFDELLGEARLMYRLRDERGIYSDNWASGLMRRAALAAGRRVAGRGRIRDPEHMVDATLDEMCALVTDSGGPSADELATRFDELSAWLDPLLQADPRYRAPRREIERARDDTARHLADNPDRARAQVYASYPDLEP